MVIVEYVIFIIGLLMVKWVLMLCGVLLVMLKNVWCGDLCCLLVLNWDIMLCLLLLQLCFGVLIVFGVCLGSDIVVVNVVLMIMLIFIVYVLDGFVYVVEVYFGQVYGVCDGSQLLEVWWVVCWQFGMVVLVFVLIYSLVGQYIIVLLILLFFLQQLVDCYLIWQMILLVVGVWCYLLDGMFIGVMCGVEMRNSMVVVVVGFVVMLFMLLVFGNYGLWLVLVVFFVLCGLLLVLIWCCYW